MSWNEKYQIWKQANPHVLPLFIRFAKEVKAAGFKHYGPNGVIGRIRWFTDVETKADPFKINENFGAYLAREAMEQEPELQGFFRIRRLRS